MLLPEKTNALEDLSRPFSGDIESFFEIGILMLELLESLSVFDEFRGAGIAEDSRSLGWRLTFRHPERTLRDREIQGRTAKILSTLEAALGIRQRTS